MPLFTVLMSGFGVRLRLFVLAHVVEMGGLVMMVGRSVMICGRLMVMLTSRMLGFCHDEFLLTVPRNHAPGAASTGQSSRMQVSHFAALRMHRPLTLGSENYKRVTFLAREAHGQIEGTLGRG